MAATYDGVAFAALIWLAILILWRAGVFTIIPPVWSSFVLMLIVLGFACCACLREAGRYVNHQMEELTS